MVKNPGYSFAGGGFVKYILFLFTFVAPALGWAVSTQSPGAFELGTRSRDAFYVHYLLPLKAFKDEGLVIVGPQIGFADVREKEFYAGFGILGEYKYTSSVLLGARLRERKDPELQAQVGFGQKVNLTLGFYTDFKNDTQFQVGLGGFVPLFSEP
jgi:hypothetical protein